ncbi:MAG TPA: DNA polymerase III subunit delta [Gaiella sp.]|nr:DNA polymerase III subunit delta [Gaiella sp.]
MAATELKPAYVVSGDDRPKIEHALARLRARFDPSAVERLGAAGPEGASGPDVVMACNAGSLLGDARLVLVTEIDGRRNEYGRPTGGWKAADIDAVTEYLAAPAPGTVLCLVGEGVKRDSPLAKAVAKVGEVLTYEVGRNVEAWVATRFRDRGIDIDREACRTLIEIVGDDKLALGLEIDKLATWADGEPLGVEEVRRLATPFREEAPWALTDAWGSHDVAAALTVMENDLAQRPRAPRDEAPRLSGQLAGHLAKLAAMKRLLEEGLRAKDAAAKLGLKPYPAQKLARQAEGFSVEELRDASIRLAELDHALKGGSRLPAELSLQLAIADLARERG